MDKPELPWSNKSVRHALAMAIDYNSIIKDYYKGDAMFAFPISPYKAFLQSYTSPEQWPQAVKDIYTYNPTKAKQLLAEAGYPDGFKINVLTMSTYVDDLSLIKEYWRKIGVDMTIDVKETGVFNSMTAGFQQKEAVGYYGGGSDPFDMDQYTPDNIDNHSRVNDQFAVQVYKDTREGFVTDRPKLGPKVKEFYNYALEQAWDIVLPGPNGYNMWQPWVKNYRGEVDLGPCTRLIWGAYVWIDQSLKKSLGF
ncbi:MAG: hypothetical protein HYU83_05115 [Chloroflexi bacterium]|nr:hypothetical protein [Chloroflexota bacterium]